VTIITRSRLIEMANNIIEAIESIRSDDSEYMNDMNCRSSFIKDKSNCKITERTLVEDIWASELFSLIIEAERYLSEPNLWMPDLPLIAWNREQELLAQIVDDGDEEINVYYHPVDSNATTVATFVGGEAKEGEIS